jgi:hypothetical protein
MLTQKTLDLFLRLAQDAPEWNGTPLLDITSEERGNVTALKLNKLLTTFKDEGLLWVQFTDAGKALAKEHLGITISD